MYRDPLGHLNDAEEALTRHPVGGQSAPRPRFVETVEQAPQVRVLLMSQVACRPWGASVFDAHTFALPVVKAMRLNADGLASRP